MAAKTMWDYLSVVDADNNVILNVSPNKIITEEGSKNASIRTADDGTEKRVSLSDTPIFYVTLIFSNRNASDIGTVMDFYYDSSKGNGNAESFTWIHPTDTHRYTVRFDGKFRRQLINVSGVVYTVPAVRLRILGAGDREIDAENSSSSTEITAPGFDVVWMLDAPDVSSNSEITAPSFDVVWMLDAPDNSSSSEITAPSLDGVRAIDSAGNSSSSEITAPTIGVV